MALITHGRTHTHMYRAVHTPTWRWCTSRPATGRAVEIAVGNPPLSRMAGLAATLGCVDAGGGRNTTDRSSRRLLPARWTERPLLAARQRPSCMTADHTVIWGRGGWDVAGSLTARGHGHPGTRWARSRSHVPGCWVFRHLGVQLDARCQKHGSWVSWEWGGVRCVPGVSGAQGRWVTHWGVE